MWPQLYCTFDFQRLYVCAHAHDEKVKQAQSQKENFGNSNCVAHFCLQGHSLTAILWKWQAQLIKAIGVFKMEMVHNSLTEEKKPWGHAEVSSLKEN